MKGKADRIVELAKRRGFFWPALEVYGGVSGFVALGDLGVKLKDRVIELWRSIFVKRHSFVEVDTPLINPYMVFEASGHVGSFKDPMAECTNCHKKFRADHLMIEHGIHVPEGTKLEVLEDELNTKGVKCPECGNERWQVKHFLTMFSTVIGPYSENEGFLRPETAQGIFVEFKRLFDVARSRMPIGIAQIGRAFRNEISPRQGVVRLREFSMMELEFFFDPLEPKCPFLNVVEKEKLRLLPEELVAKGVEEPLVMSVSEALNSGAIKQEWLAYFMALSKGFVTALGVPEEGQRFHAKLPGERAHYSAQTYDHEVLLDRFGWVEVAGHAYRTDYDLTAHTRKSSEDFTVTVQSSDGSLRRFMPHVVEPSFGIERLIYATLEYAYWEKEKDRVVLRLNPSLAPMQAGVFPLMAKDHLVEKAKEVWQELRAEGLEAIYDYAGSIGRRYARADEVGIPYSITIDYQTLENGSVTVRDRDTWEQIRVAIDDLPKHLKESLRKSRS